MSTLADRTIAAIRDENDTLTALASVLTGDQIETLSGASEWSVAQVYSHLGSGAEITLASLRAAVGAISPPSDGFNEGVWARWNAMSASEQVAAFVESGADLVAALDALDSSQRESVEVSLGFLPTPISIASFAGMRLSEITQHGWDIRVASDPGAALRAETAQVLAEHFSGALSFLLGFAGKPDALTERAVIDIVGSDFGLAIDDSARLTATPEAPTATLAGPLESVIRLVGGRLSPQHTPGDVALSGNITLDQLRAVFPGY